jgi:hypothetical protein
MSNDTYMYTCFITDRLKRMYERVTGNEGAKLTWHSDSDDSD